MSSRALRNLEHNPPQFDRDFAVGKRVSPALTAMLGTAFPKRAGAAVATDSVLTSWFYLYLWLNHLQEGSRIVLDDFLGGLAGKAPGTVISPGELPRIIRSQTLDSVFLESVERLQLAFIAKYLELNREILRDKSRGDYETYRQLDPQREFYKGIRRPMSPRV